MLAKPWRVIFFAYKNYHFVSHWRLYASSNLFTPSSELTSETLWISFTCQIFKFFWNQGWFENVQKLSFSNQGWFQGWLEIKGKFCELPWNQGCFSKFVRIPVLYLPTMIVAIKSERLKIKLVISFILLPYDIVIAVSLKLAFVIH